MTTNEITHSAALAMHGRPVRIETQNGKGGTFFGEVVVGNMPNTHWGRAYVKFAEPPGYLYLPGDPQSPHGSFSSDGGGYYRVTPASREELIAHLERGYDVPNPRWVVGDNLWQTNYGPHPYVIADLADHRDWTKRQPWPRTFRIKDIRPNTRTVDYKLLDDTSVRYPIRGFKYQLRDGYWINDVEMLASRL